MNQSQKRWAEFPILLLLIWVFQGLELSVLRIPFQHGAVQMAPVIVVYVALTRNWEKLAWLSLFFGFLGSFTVGYSWIVYVAAQFWMGLAAKVFISGFTIDSKISFAFLVSGCVVFSKLLAGFLLKVSGIDLLFLYVARDSIFSALASGVLAYLVYSFFLAWDDYFDHPHIDASEINPDIIK